MVQDAALKLREQLLEQEKNFMASQNEWLSEDLNQKTDELLQLKKEKATLLTSVESTTTVRDDEVNMSSSYTLHHHYITSSHALKLMIRVPYNYATIFTSNLHVRALNPLVLSPMSVLLTPLSSVPCPCS